MKGIADDVLPFDQGVAAIVVAANERDALSVVNEVYKDFSDVLSTNWEGNESFKNYEACFAAQFSKLPAHGNCASLHELIIGMMLLEGSAIDYPQGIPILSATGSCQSASVNQNAEEILFVITYESVASMIRQCDLNSSSASSTSSAVKVSNASYESASSRRNHCNQSNTPSRNKNFQPSFIVAGLPLSSARRSCAAFAMVAKCVVIGNPTTTLTGKSRMVFHPCCRTR